MPETPRPAAPRTYAWWLVLGVVGLDYFSTLAYLPSVAVEAVGGAHKALAPLAAVGVVAVTLLAAVPVYLCIVGRSPDGQGAVGLLERLVHGWRGKTLVLVLLGFVATDYVVTRSLSVADAAVHLTHDPFWRRLDLGPDLLRTRLPVLPAWVADRMTEQLIVTVALSLLGFLFYALLLRGFGPRFVRSAAAVVGVYLLLNALVIGAALIYLGSHPRILQQWWARDVPARSDVPVHDLVGMAGLLSLVLLVTFPQLALGLSGFELTMANAPLVRGRPDDDPARPRGRVRNTRLMLVVAAVVMSLFVLGSIFAVSLLVPESGLREDGRPIHRALAYLAHGGELATGPGETLGPLFGPWFGLAYDALTILILCMAGASATIAFRGMVPHFLSRFGMELRWARKVGAVQHLFNGVILLVTVVFHASVTDQQWAYATSVLVLLTSASAAALLDLAVRWRGLALRPLAMLPFAAVTLFLLCMIGGLFVRLQLSGFAIALGFVVVLLATAFTSRWLRSTEPRFEGFAFADEATKKRWQEVCELDFQVLAPHRPGPVTLMAMEEDVRRKHRLGPDVPIIFIEAFVGDPSDFAHAPLMRIDREEGREIIRVYRCASVAHVLASIALEFRRVGRPPELYFDWSLESPLAANLHFLLMGEGNIPWMVHELIRRGEPDAARRPRVVVG